MIGAATAFLVSALAVLFAAGPVAAISRRASYLLSLAGALLLIAAASCVLGFGSGAPLRWPSPIGGTEGIGLDGLSAYFALIAGVVWTATAAYSLGYDRDYSRTLAASFAVTLASIALLIAAQDAVLFLIGWEGMTIASYAMILQARGRPSRVFSAAFIFLAFGEASTLFVVLALAGLRWASGTFQFVPVATGGLLASGVFVAAMVGFGLKMGVAPFHMSEWLPIAHSSAPSNASAVLSATLTLAGVYGLFRIVSLLGPGPAWWGAVLLAIGAISALLGAMYASVSEHTKGLPAYSTIENNGLVLVALGVALTARAEGLPVLFDFALFAALFQVFAHATAKAALFLYAGYVDRTAGTFDLNAIEGRAKDAGGPAFPGSIAAALSLAAAPPLAGFVSEWMILECLFQSYRFPDPTLRFLALVAGAAVALAAGLMLVAMVKFLGFAQLWNPTEAPAQRRARPLGAAVLGLAGVVGGLGVGAPWILRLAGAPANAFSASRLAVPVSGAANLDLPAGWSILSGAPFGILSPPGIPLALAIGSLAALGYFALGGRGSWRRASPWMAGNPTVPPETYTAFGFSTGLRVMLSGLFRTREVRSESGPSTLASVQTPESYDVELEVLDVFKIFYDKLRSGTLALAGWLKGALMPGRVGQYVAYLLVTALVVIVYVVAAYSPGPSG